MKIQIAVASSTHLLSELVETHLESHNLIGKPIRKATDTKMRKVSLVELKLKGEPVMATSDFTYGLNVDGSFVGIYRGSDDFSGGMYMTHYATITAAGVVQMKAGIRNAPKFKKFFESQLKTAELKALLKDAGAAAPTPAEMRRLPQFEDWDLVDASPYRKNDGLIGEWRKKFESGSTFVIQLYFNHMRKPNCSLVVMSGSYISTGVGRKCFVEDLREKLTELQELPEEGLSK